MNRNNDNCDNRTTTPRSNSNRKRIEDDSNNHTEMERIINEHGNYNIYLHSLYIYSRYMSA